MPTTGVPSYVPLNPGVGGANMWTLQWVSTVVPGQTVQAEVVHLADGSGNVIGGPNLLPVGATQVGNWNVGSVNSDPLTGQGTVTLSAAPIVGSSVPSSKNCVYITGFPNNSEQGFFIGPVGVTRTTGQIILPGMMVPFTCSDLNKLFVVGWNLTDQFCWNVL